LWRRLLAYCKVAAPVYLFFLAVDRIYQFYRFGSFTNTYVSIFAREERQIDPTLPANFPWSTPFTKAFSARSSSGEVYFSVRSSARPNSLPADMALEAHDS